MIGDVVARIVRSDGLQFTIGDGEWRIPNDGLENWANLPYEVQSIDMPTYDGGVIMGKRVASVDRSIRAIAADAKNNERLRETAISFFNPIYNYKVYITYMGRTRIAKGEQIGFKCSEGNIYQPVEINWSILCSNPYLQSNTETAKSFSSTMARLGFPFMSFIPVSQGSVEGCNVGFVASVYKQQDGIVLENDGDVPAGLRVVMMAQGSVVNPRVKIGDIYVSTNTRLHTGDRLVMDFTSMPPKVTLNGKNAMNILDKRSNILDMKLPVGSSDIECSAAENSERLAVEITYNQQYLGI